MDYIEIGAMRGYEHCQVSEETLHNHGRNYPCDLKPRPRSTGILLVTFINEGWIPMVRNWICSAERVGLKDKIYLISLEKGVCNKLQDTQVPCYQYPNATIKYTKFGQLGYQKMMIERTKLVLKLLSCGATIFMVDTDIVFLKNPLTYLEGISRNMDIVFQADSTEVKMLDSILPYIFDYICGGFIYIIPNSATKYLWLSILQYQLNFLWNDQAGLNICIRHYSRRIRWRTLNSKYFPNGQQYFIYGERHSDAMIVHANHLRGEDNKIFHLVAEDLWCYVPAAVKMCKKKFMYQIKCASSHSRWCVAFANVCRQKYNVNVT